MNIRELDRIFLNELNEFLSNGKAGWSKNWGNKEEIKNMTEGNLNNEQLGNILESTNRHLVIVGLSLLPNFRDEEEIARDYGLNNFYKYSNNACSFSSFKISRYLPSTLNDHKEGKWFNKYLSKISSGVAKPAVLKFFDQMIKKYNPLVTYTTTTLVNHKYMISNYSRVGKQCIGYNGGQIIENYDSLFSGKIKPIRGFVRYSDDGKDYFIKYIIKISSIRPKVAEFLLAIASTFMKGICMKEEAEYRFLILTTNLLDALDINCAHKKCEKFSCSLESENPFYTSDKYDCEKDRTSERCNYNLCNGYL